MYKITETIEEYMQTFYPDAYKFNEWGCHMIGFEGRTEAQLKREFPSGIPVDLPTGKYWVWFKHMRKYFHPDDQEPAVDS